ncbi:hypothetical protein SFC43_26605 [Bacteroides sp. CR5/BHMF/2]|nr:hypothetical protein [Bacteroides sp. CR5/BHMF/2]
MVTSANEEVVTAEVDGNIVKLKAVEGKNDAQSVVYVKDKYDQRVKIFVNTAATFDLKLSQNLFTLYSQVEGADEATVRIYTGNGGYTVGFHQEGMIQFFLLVWKSMPMTWKKQKCSPSRGCTG